MKSVEFNGYDKYWGHVVMTTCPQYLFPIYFSGSHAADISSVLLDLLDPMYAMKAEV